MKILLATLVVAVGFCISGVSAQEKTDDVVGMIGELLKESDRDMRALAFQQIRSEAPGEAATKAFAAMLPKLPPETQAGLLDALAERRDRAALAAVKESLTSDQETVRAAALRALGALGGGDEAPLLAQRAARAAGAEQLAARASLVRLKGDGVNAAIVATVRTGDAPVRREGLAALAGRGARDHLPAVFAATRDPDPSVRLAALAAVRFLAAEGDAAGVVDALLRATTPEERDKAELALLTVCSRGREKCAAAVAAGLDKATGPVAAALLHALARSGGPAALAAVSAAASARVRDADAATRDEAVRVLAYWPDRAVAPILARIAADADASPRQRVLANRGLARWGDPRAAGPLAPKPAATSTASSATKRGPGPSGFAPMPLELPLPAFRGTPVPLNEPNVEKPSGRPRPPFLAPRGTVNLARGKRVSCSDAAPSAGELDYVTDGRKDASDFSLLELRPGLEWVQIDLGARATIYAVVVWHNHAEARVYRDVIVQVSDDPDFLEAVTVFNNDADNTAGQGAGKDRGYVETSEGKLIDARGVEGRYVRAYSRGNHVDPKNHYTEIEVFGRPVE